MSRIKIWKCDHHKGCYFEKKPAYRNHLREIATARRYTKDYLLEINDLEVIVQGVYKCGSIQDVVEYIMENDQVFILNTLRVHNNHLFKRLYKAINDKWLVKLPHLTSIDISSTYHHLVSNSHSCPRDGVRNWGRMDKDQPTGYPGWVGRLNMYFDSEEISITAPSNKKGQRKWKYIVYVGSEMLTRTGIHTGTGGGGKHTSFDISIFEQDWPSFKPAMTMAKLAADNPAGTDWADAIGSGYID